MKNIKAILIAFLMFAVTVTAVKFVATKEMPKYSVKYGTWICLLYTSPSPRDAHESRMPSSA